MIFNAQPNSQPSKAGRKFSPGCFTGAVIARERQSARLLRKEATGKQRVSCRAQLTAVMGQNVKGPSVDAAVAPGSGVDLRLEQREIEALHVALAAGVAQRLEIRPVRPLVLVRQLLG